MRDITEQVESRRKINEYASALKKTNIELHDTQDQLVQSAKLASLGNLVAGVAHEINTPLGVVHSNANLAARALDMLKISTEKEFSSEEEEKRNRNLQKILTTLEQANVLTLKASSRIDTIVSALRQFAGLDKPERNTVSLHDGIDSCLTILPQNQLASITITKKYGSIPEINCYPIQLNQVFMSLLVNAVESIDGEGTITITTFFKDEKVNIEVRDTGRGISKGIIDNVFDPGFTTKGVGVGTGLGLSSAYRIIEDHHGKIDITSEEGIGTLVTVQLPIT